MMSDAKAGLLLVAILIVTMFSGLGYSESNRQGCRLKAMELKYPAEQIAQICK